ncbi:hypothetical protein B0A48_12566 [Cryoendolithus antarcticus]|uniref:RecQ-mediated genome instability protein 1 n=1 Tax=Cryoendolithus antarcticus TaxID=1507870 RepID=A0A1V8SRA1_9PEZI|nr:hypothetical protein B0A48_12566 [Cryoendolithus antarcticus]
MTTQRPAAAIPANNTAMNDIRTSIATHLASKNVPPTPAWLASFLPSIRTSTPLQALQKTALFRILATDITTTLATIPATSLPANIANAAVKELRLPGPIVVQVLDIEDIGHSRWSQFEALEAQKRGETRRGHEVIRVIPEEGNVPAPVNASAGPHKLLLQDGKGTKVYGFEMRDVGAVNVGMGIGAKMVLRGVTVARGVVMLEPGGVEVLGGKVEAWDKKWREERKEVLKQQAGVGLDG